MAIMQKWIGKDYIGPDYREYFILYGRHRDSNNREESNWRSILKYLEKKPEVKYIIFRASHWAVGWVEQILIRQDDNISVSAGNEIVATLSEYPVFNDDDYSNLQWEKAREIQKEIRNNIENLDDRKQLHWGRQFNEKMTDDEIMDAILESDMVD